MRFVSTGMAILLINSVFGQILDSFSDGNFSSNPSWFGDTTKFSIESNTLCLKAPYESGTAFLSTRGIRFAAVIYEISVKMLFNPSGLNYCDIYLISDNPELVKPLNGYFIRIGDANDAISLYRQDSVSNSKNCIIRGTNGLVNKSEVNLRVKAIRNEAGSWSLYADTTAGNNLFLIGISTDSRYNPDGYFGILCNYTSTRADKFIFDDISIYPDPEYLTKPLKVDTVISFSEKALQVTFNKPLKNHERYTWDSFVLNPGNQCPDSVNFLSSSNDILLFFNDLTNNFDYRLSIFEIEDVFGNILESTHIFFTFFLPHNAAYGDIIINELMGDPTPTAGLPETEYVELFNKSDYAIDMTGWQINGCSIPKCIALPKNYYVLCNHDLTHLFSEIRNLVGIEKWNSINNDFDEIILSDKKGLEINYAFYDPQIITETYKKNGGWSHERINPYLTCDHPQNWNASIDKMGGTPGFQNSVYNDVPDSFPPSLISHDICQNILKLNFSEPIDYTENMINRVLISELSCSEIQPNRWKDEFLLLFDNPFSEGMIYEIQLHDLEDCQGNKLTDTIFSSGVGKQPEFQELIINEIMADPAPSAGLPESEYIELFNTTEYLIAITHCILIIGADTIVLPYRKIYPGEFLILVAPQNEQIMNSFGFVLGIKNFPSIKNTGENICVLDSMQNLIHTMGFTKETYRNIDKENGGFSIEIIDPCFPHRNGNWIASDDPSGGTPGMPNSVLSDYPDLTGPKLLSAIPVTRDSITLIFDEKLHPYKIDNISISIDENTGVLDFNFDIKFTEKLYLISNTPLKPGYSYRITVNNITDCADNLIQQEFNTAFFVLPEKPDSLDIIINEILFHPLPGGVEFVEIYNKSEKHIDLSGYEIARKVFNNSALSAPLITDHRIMPPGKYYALTKNENLLKSDFPYASDKNLIEIEYLPSLPDDEGTICLLMPDGTVSDEFTYNKNMHNGLLDDNSGVSIERINPNHETNDIHNWHSASSSCGYGTPGEINSQHFQSDIIPGTIQVNPRIFVPDYNGSCEILTISYAFDSPGYNANIEIYDLQGRKIKEIMENAILGTNGLFTWDGRNDMGLKTNLGYYVLIFEIWNLRGDFKIYRESIIVGAQF